MRGTNPSQTLARRTPAAVAALLLVLMALAPVMTPGAMANNHPFTHPVFQGGPYVLEDVPQHEGPVDVDLMVPWLVAGVPLETNSYHTLTVEFPLSLGEAPYGDPGDILAEAVRDVALCPHPVKEDQPVDRTLCVPLEEEAEAAEGPPGECEGLLGYCVFYDTEAGNVSVKFAFTDQLTGVLLSLTLPGTLQGTSDEYLLSADGRTLHTGQDSEYDPVGFKFNTIAIDRLLIRDAPGGQGSPVRQIDLAPDESIDLFAAGYESGGHFVGDVWTNWNIDNSAAGTLNPEAGISTNFTAGTAGAQGVLNATRTGDDGPWDTADVNVASGPLDEIRICETDAGCASTIASLSLETGEETTLYAIGYDSVDNFIGLQNADWTSSDNDVATVGSATGTSTLVTGEDEGTATITATQGEISEDVDVDVGIGDLANIRICLAGGGCDGITSVSFDADAVAGGSAVFWAAGYNAHGTFLGDEPVTWDVEQTPEPESEDPTESYSFTETLQGDYTITASSSEPGVDSVMVDVTVTPGVLAELEIRTDETEPCEGVIEGETTINAGDGRNYCLLGFDAHTNQIGPVEGSWKAMGGIGAFDENEGSEVTFTAQRTGTGYIEASVGEDFSTRTEDITVEAGGLDRLTIQYRPDAGNTPVKSTVTTTDGDLDTQDGTWVFWAVGYDAFDNYIGPMEDAEWSGSTGFGNITSNGDGSAVFDPHTPGIIEITADSDGVMDSTGPIAIVHGALSQLEIRTGPLGAEKELNGAPIGDPVGEQKMTAGDTILLFAAGYDRDDNYLGERPVEWSVEGGCGEITTLVAEEGLLARFKAKHVTDEECFIVAYHEEELTVAGVPVTRETTAMAGPIQVNPGPPVELAINDANGVRVDEPVYRAGEQHELFAAMTDEFGNNAGTVDEDAEWEVVGGCGSLSSDTGPSVIFEARSVAEVGDGCRVVVRVTTESFPFDETLEADTGDITVKPEFDADRVRIRSQPDNGGIEISHVDFTTDDNITVYAASYDSFGNYMGDLASTSWEADAGNEDLLDFAPTGGLNLLEPQKPGQLVLTATVDDAVAELEITIGLGALAQILIVDINGDPVGDKVLQDGESIDLYADGFDGKGNLIGATEVDWSVLAGCGELSAEDASTSTTFTAGTIPVNGCGVQAATDGLTDSIGITIIPPDPDLLQVEVSAGGAAPADLSGLTAGSTHTLHAAGYLDDGADDGSDLFLDNFPADWAVVGGCGVLLDGDEEVDTIDGTTSVEFQPQLFDQTGNCKVTATLVDYATLSEILVVSVTDPGPLDRLEISEVVPTATAITMDAGERKEFEALGFDEWDNPIGRVVVSWSVTEGDCGSILGGTSAENATFRAETVGTCSLTAGKGITDSASVEITVGPGAPFELKQELLAMVVPAGTPYQQKVTLFDAWDNQVDGSGLNVCLDVPEDPNAPDGPFSECKPIPSGTATFDVTLYTSDPQRNRRLGLTAFIEDPNPGVMPHSRNVRVVAGVPDQIGFDNDPTVTILDPAKVRVLVNDTWGNPVEDGVFVSFFVEGNSNLADLLHLFVVDYRETVDGAVEGTIYTLSIDEAHEYKVEAQVGDGLTGVDVIHVGWPLPQ